MLDALIVPRSRDLGDGFHVRRSLPAVERRAVGPFVFFDQMGPVAFAAQQGLDVRPHPHIGLATITYLFEGEILHRDSLGTVQAIRPGEVNWMTAGKGIVHSERTPQALRKAGSRASGIQAWVALPREHEEDPPAFVHLGAESLPVLDEGKCRIRLIIGTLFGARSPVPTRSEMFYADATIEAGGKLALRAEHEERAAYVSEGMIELDGRQYGAGQMLIFKPGSEAALGAPSAARLLLLGGASLGPRFISWNFVSSRKERIAQAAEDWKAGRFAPVPGETEFIPLPERAPGVADAAAASGPAG
jgi:redox-sensitive bicupin YhaK (pirin superfamily)